MNYSFRLLLAIAKQLLRLRIENAKRQNWLYYARPGTCLYGPHGGVGFWSNHRDLEKILKQNDLPFHAYDAHAQFPSGQVLELAKKLADRHERFIDHVNNWTLIDGIHYADNSVEIIEINNFGEKRQRQIVAPSGDACF